MLGQRGKGNWIFFQNPKLPAGNVSTEDLVHMLQRMGLCRDVDLETLLEVARQVGAFFERELPGFILKSGSLVDFQGRAA